MLSATVGSHWRSSIRLMRRAWVSAPSSGVSDKHDRELVAADPPDDVGRPDLGAQRVGDRHERVIARRVTVGVVDLLEVVDVDDDEAQRRS